VAERESFLAAIERNRRAAGHLRLASDACALVLAFVVGLLMAPLLYAILGLLLDIVNHVVATPDLIGSATTTVGDMLDHPESVTRYQVLRMAAIAAVPGMCLMLVLLWTLGRVMRAAMQADHGVDGRPIDSSMLGEQRFANTVAEMAIAAGIPAPRVLVTESEAVNAAAYGVDRDHARIVITTALLKLDNRAALQGVAADLVGSIANGDIAIGARVATLLGMFGLVAKLSESFADREAARRLGRLWRHALWPVGSAGADGELAMALTNPFEAGNPQPAIAEESGKVPWRTLAWMPFAGPLVISGFFGGVLCAFVLGPLLALMWRRRKYLADATAVRLTRDPDTLGTALENMRGLPVGGAFGNWIAHLSVVPSGLIGAKSIFGGSSVPMSPALDKRLKALGVMGAHVAPRQRAVMPMWTKVLLAPVIALLVALMGAVVIGLAYVSLALSGLFTWLPAVLLHALLR
jgi:Zn-dependent protease with chaperone function